MKTLSQERAAFAYEKVKTALSVLKKSDKETKKISKEFSSFVAGLPAMIIQNGLGHTLCFLLAKDANNRNTKYWQAFEAIGGWLKKRNLLPFDPAAPDDTIKAITQKDALQYLAIQEEALRFLEWFNVMSKMFVEEKDART